MHSTRASEPCAKALSVGSKIQRGGTASGKFRYNICQVFNRWLLLVTEHSTLLHTERAASFKKVFQQMTKLVKFELLKWTLTFLLFFSLIDVVMICSINSCNLLIMTFYLMKLSIYY